MTTIIIDSTSVTLHLIGWLPLAFMVIASYLKSICQGYSGLITISCFMAFSVRRQCLSLDSCTADVAEGSGDAWLDHNCKQGVSHTRAYPQSWPDTSSCLVWSTHSKRCQCMVQEWRCLDDYSSTRWKMNMQHSLGLHLLCSSPKMAKKSLTGIWTQNI